MTLKKPGINTICTHIGEVKDEQFQGAISPLYMSSSYQYDGVDVKRYPRYFNTPNQEALCKKVAMLEKKEAGMIFGSGMAATSTAILAFLQKGDHIVLQKTLYGGTYNFVVEELNKFGITYSFTNGFSETDFTSAITKNTKVIFVETPSNPLMLVTDLEMVARIAKERNIVTMIDNTFASPVNQTPDDFGIDICIHSATKYMSGHSDILAGTIACSKALRDRIAKRAKMLGGNLSDLTVWLLDRSIKTMGLRVDAQNKNAMIMATWLEAQPQVDRVFYPGLTSHPDHVLAQSQMCGFGGVVSFELSKNLSAVSFLNHLKLIKRASSFAGVESTAVIPALTSHSLLTSEQRAALGISDQLIRFSVGIESAEELQNDIAQAF